MDCRCEDNRSADSRSGVISFNPQFAFSTETGLSLEYEAQERSYMNELLFREVIRGICFTKK
jgi:hypothetical protein